jgi:hypothetical protein
MASSEPLALTVHGERLSDDAGDGRVRVVPAGETLGQARGLARGRPAAAR